MARTISSKTKRIIALIESLGDCTVQDVGKKAFTKRQALSVKLQYLADKGYIQKVGYKKVGNARGRPSAIYRPNGVCKNKSIVVVQHDE